jgi:hypothetical protein
MDVPFFYFQQDQYNRVLSNFEIDMNVGIDSIVEWYVCSDRSYHTLPELESIILRRMKPHFLVEHDNVEGYGYGSLASRSEVARFFMLPDLCSSSKLKHPSYKDIVSVALTYYPLVKPMKKQATQQNKNFNDFMRVQLAKLYNCSEYLIGIRVKLYKPFFDFYLRAKALELKRQAYDAKILGKDERDKARLESSISVGVSTITQQKIRSLTADLICLEAAHTGLKNLIASTVNAGHRGSFDRPASTPTGIDPSILSTSTELLHLEDATVLWKKLQSSAFSRGELPKAVVTVLSAFICILSLVAFGPRDESEENASTPDFFTSKACMMDEVVRQCDDIPPFLLKSLRQLLHSIITPTFMNTMHIRSNVASDFIRRMIFGRINRMNKEKDLSDVRTASIAVHFILQNPQSCLATVNTAVKATTLVQTEAKKTSGALNEEETGSDLCDDSVQAAQPTVEQITQTGQPTATRTALPTAQPTATRPALPTAQPTATQTALPTDQPSATRPALPTAQPSATRPALPTD